MKKAIILLSIFLCSLLGTSQTIPLLNVGDTIPPIRLINFDDSLNFISVDTASQNIWQIGTPQKTYFNAAYSGSRAIVTDTTNPYTSNNYSYFDLYLGTYNLPWYPWNIFMDFKQKYDTDTLKDGGYITVSWDKGLTWMNIIKDSVYNQYGGGAIPGNDFYIPSINLYTENDTLSNGEYGFSGKSYGWVHTAFSWFYLPVKFDFPPDTMIVRFNFISDNIDNPKDGWMIDDIKLYAIDLGGGIYDIPFTENFMTVSPNPMNSVASIFLDKYYNKAEFEVFDSKGNSVMHNFYTNCDSFTFEKNQLPQGIYYIKVTFDNNVTQTKKIIIN